MLALRTGGGNSILGPLGDPAPLGAIAHPFNAGRQSRDLGIRVGSCIFGVRDQPVDRPPFDLVGRPRLLISVNPSRAGARTR